MFPREISKVENFTMKKLPLGGSNIMSIKKNK